MEHSDEVLTCEVAVNVGMEILADDQQVINLKDFVIPEFTCVICDDDCVGFGNNPEPIKPIKDGMCCDKCNYRVICPARWAERSIRK